MNKKILTFLTAACAGAILMTGCSGSSGISTDNLTIAVYKGVEVPKVDKPAEVTDADVDAAIDSALQTNATTTEVKDRAVEDGDTVNIDYVGKIDGEEFEGGSAKGTSLQIGSGKFIEGFEESVIGHMPGETYDWNGKFPDNYSKAEYAGKDVVFTITVNAIEEQSAPELNDEFVKTVSKESKTVKEYKKEMKKQLEEQAEASYKDSLGAEVWQAVLDGAKVKKYPEDEVNEMKETLINQYKEVAQYYGTDYETMIKEQMGGTVEEFEKEIGTAAESSIKQTMVTDAIADKEKIKLTDKEYKTRAKKLAESYGYESIEDLEKAASKDDIKDIILNNMVKEWLVDHSVQVDSAKSSESGTAGTDESKASGETSEK